MTPKRKLLAEALDNVKRYEGFREFAYPDPASPLHENTPHLRRRWGREPAAALLATLPPNLAKLSGAPWTCGYGHTQNVTFDLRCSHAQALMWLDDDLDDSQIVVEEFVTVPINDYQYGALVSLVFNIGGGAFAKSTLLKRLNEGNYRAALERFDDFVKVRDRGTGKLEYNEGLYNRRQLEKAFFLRGSFVSSRSDDIKEETPSEAKPISKDTSMTVPIGTGVATAGAAVTEAASKFEPLAAYSETLKTVFIILSVIGVLTTLYLQYRKRQEKS